MATLLERLRDRLAANREAGTGVPGFLERLRAGQPNQDSRFPVLASHANALLGFAAGGLGGDWGDAFAGFANGNQMDQQSNDAIRARQQQQQQTDALGNAIGTLGLSPEMEALALAYPDLGISLAANALMPPGGGDPTTDMQNYQYAVSQGYQGTFDDWQHGGGGDNREIREDQNGVLRYVDTGEPVFPDVTADPTQPDPADVQRMRQEYNGLTADFRVVEDAYRRVEASAADPSAAGDLALIFNYMKMLDPNSVVRESEFATAQNAAGVPDTVRALWNRLLNGERMSENQRADFVDRAARLYAAAADGYNSYGQTYRTLAEQAGFDPTQVVPPHTFVGGYQPSAASNFAAPGAISPSGGNGVTAPVQPQLPFELGTPTPDNPLGVPNLDTYGVPY